MSNLEQAARQALEALIAYRDAIHFAQDKKALMAAIAYADANAEYAIQSTRTALNQPQDATQMDSSDAEFLSVRLARVAKLAGVQMPDKPHEQIAQLAGTILGDVARNLENAQTQAIATGDQLKDATRSLEWHKRRIDLLQQWQSKMRDPERTIFCDIIANGQTLEPADNRYTLQPSAPAVPDGYKLVPVEQLAEWKSLANEAAARGLPTERHQVAQKLTQKIADVVNAAPEPKAPPPILEDLKELFKKSGKPKVLTGPCGQCGDTKHPCFCSTVDVPFEDSSPTVTSHRQPLTTEQYTQLAHRIASRYSHRSDPQFIAYTFLPHTLEQFVRAIESAISNQ